MLNQELLSETLETANLECWENERTATPVRAFAVRLHATGCSLRETKEILRLFGVKRSHQAVFQWVHRLADSVSDPPSAAPTRVAVDETAVKINGEWSWVYAAIDIETKLLLGIDVFDRHGTDQAAVFLSELAEKHDLSDAMFLVDGYGYRTALFRIGLSGQLDYTERNLIEKWFHTLKMRIDRFHTSWVGSRPSVQRWLEQFVHYYNHQRPHQSLTNRTPIEEELN
ncbi:IS6 family transposase [Haladaptatus sp. NG-SE-30]